MAREGPAIALPSIALLSHETQVSASARSLRRLLTRLPRAVLLRLAQRWLSEEGRDSAGRPLHTLCLSGSSPSDEGEQGDDRDPAYFECAQSLEEVKEIYSDLSEKASGGKREVVDRVLEIDWKNGLSLWQVATVDTALLCGLDGSGKAGRWTALRVVPDAARSSAMAAGIEGQKRAPGDTGRLPLGEVDANAGSESRGASQKQQKKGPQPFKGAADEVSVLPQLHIPVLKRTLVHFLSPLAKLHITSHSFSAFPNLTALRISSLEAPYAASAEHNKAGPSAIRFGDEHLVELLSKSIWLAIPAGSPHIFVSFGNSANLPVLNSRVAEAHGTRSVGAWRRSILGILPKALSSCTIQKSIPGTASGSKPSSRNQQSVQWKLQPTNLSAKGLSTMIALRGSDGNGACQGSWSIFARNQDDTSAHNGPAPDGNPLDIDSIQALKSSEQLLSEAVEAYDASQAAKQPSSTAAQTVENPAPTSQPSKPSLKRSALHANLDSSQYPSETAATAQLAKKRRMLAQARFGNSARPHDGKGIERLTVRLPVDPQPADDSPAQTPPPSRTAPSGSGVGTSLRDIVAQAQAALTDPNEAGTSPSNSISRGEMPSSRRSSTRLSSSTPDPSSALNALNPPTKPQSRKFGSIFQPPASESGITMTFHGRHVHAGLRVMVEKGLVDGRRMPGWMSGEGAVSVGVVGVGRRLRGGRGIGL